jgi:hypothetical protein
MTTVFESDGGRNFAVKFETNRTSFLVRAGKVSQIFENVCSDYDLRSDPARLQRSG